MTGNTRLTVSGLTLDNSDGDAANSNSDGLPAAHNSDGFDISSSDYVTLDSINVHNQVSNLEVFERPASGSLDSHRHMQLT